jgi:hypothetical protein
VETKLEDPDGQVFEFVQEEFIDEDTNDGFEDEHGIIQEEEVETKKPEIGEERETRLVPGANQDPSSITSPQFLQETATEESDQAED